MTLSKQIIPVNFGGGVDTKTDPKLVQPGKLLTLENGMFLKGGRLSKRYGYKLLADQTLAQTAVPAGKRTATFKNELLKYTNNRLYSLSSNSGRWIDKGEWTSAIIETNDILKNTASQTNVDVAVGSNGTSIYAFEDSRGGIRASIYDETTHTAMLSDVSVSTTGVHPRCLAFGGYLYVFYYEGGNLKGNRINPVTPMAFEPTVTISKTVNTTSKLIDVAVQTPHRIVYVHDVEGASQVKVGLIDINLAADTIISTTSVNEAASNALTVFMGYQSRVFIAYHNATNGVRSTILNLGLSQLVAPTTLDSITSPIVCNITGYANAQNTGATFFYEVFNSVSYYHYVKTNTFTNAGVAGTASVLMRHSGLASKAFKYNFSGDTTDSGYVTLVQDSALQSTYFVVKNTGLIVAKIAPSLAGGIVTNLSGVWPAVSLGKFQMAISTKSELFSENATLFTRAGIASASLDFEHSNTFITAELGDTLFVTGGVVGAYDGQSVVEHGFHLYPENTSVTSQTTGGSLTLLGTYQYQAIYSWTDNWGVRHVSSPSPALSVVLTGSNNQVTVRVPTLSATMKDGTRRSAVSICLYRTETLGSIFYQVTSIVSPTFNDVSVDYVDVTDGLADSAIISREMLYTSGGVLENIGPPAASTICVFKNRVILGGLEGGNSFWYSKQYTPQSPIEFTDFFTKPIESSGKRETAVSVLDDKLLVWKLDRFYAVVGEGPNDAGTGGDFNVPQLVSTDAGCISQRSIAKHPTGVIRMTQKGIYLLDNSLNDTYIGKEVEDFNGLTINSAVLKSDTNQIRFTTAEGPMLVYDYLFQQWSTYTIAGLDALIWNNTYVYMNTAGQCLKEVAGFFNDIDSPYSLKIETSWFAFAGLQGFQRVYRFMLMGEYHSPHSLRVEVAYDYSPAYTGYYYFNPDSALDISYFGNDAIFGEYVFGGANNLYQFRGDLTTQKCESIRLKIEDVLTSSSAGSEESYNITALTFLVGTKGGLNRLPVAQKVGE